MNFLKHIFWDEKFSRLRAGWRLAIQSILLIAFLAGFGLLAKQLDDYVPRDPLDESVSILVSVAIWLSILLSVWVAGRFLDRRRFADFGFRFSPSWWMDLAFGLALGALLQTGIFLVEIASGWAAIYVLTGELAIPIGYHIEWNFFEGAVFGFPVSGYSLDASFIVTQVEGPGLWTGGAFGPEAGLLGILARVAGILMIMAWVGLRYKKLSLREELATPELQLPRRA